jgi:hypothetical protein
MKTLRWILIASRIFALTCGLAVLGSGCGDSSTGAGGPKGGLSEEEIKRNDDSKRAMEEASKKK